MSPVVPTSASVVPSGKAYLDHVTEYCITSCVSVNLLVEEVSDVTDWHTLGLKLGLTMGQLSGIHVTYHLYGVGRLKAEIFNLWLKISPNASWGDLITALNTMDEHRVAREIAACYSGQSLTAGNVRTGAR